VTHESEVQGARSCQAASVQFATSPAAAPDVSLLHACQWAVHASGRPTCVRWTSCHWSGVLRPCCLGSSRRCERRSCAACAHAWHDSQFRACRRLSALAFLTPSAPLRYGLSTHACVEYRSLQLDGRVCTCGSKFNDFSKVRRRDSINVRIARRSSSMSLASCRA